MATISVIGGANFDISAGLAAPFIANDSNPGHVSLGYGGVARNMAHNLSLLGHKVHFISIFGGDIFGGLMRDYCRNIGLDLSLSDVLKEERTGMYLCINNHSGDMIAAVADTEIINHITPAFIEKRAGELNQSDAIVCDTNLPAESLCYLLESSLVPVFVDGVSTTKAMRIIDAMQHSKEAKLHTLKLNLKEALTITGKQTPQEAAEKIINLGAEHVYITLGGEGVYCRSEEDDCMFPSLPAEVVNTTGAGDAFLAGVVHAVMQNVPFPQTAQYGLMAARATLLSEQAVNSDIANILL